MKGSPGRFWKGNTNWINNCFVLVVSVRFSINRPVRSRLIEGELKYKSFPRVVHSKVHKLQKTDSEILGWDFFRSNANGR